MGKVAAPREGVRRGRDPEQISRRAPVADTVTAAPRAAARATSRPCQRVVLLAAGQNVRARREAAALLRRAQCNAAHDERVCATLEAGRHKRVARRAQAEGVCKNA